MLYNFRRRGRLQLSKILYSIDRPQILEAFSKIGLRRGVTVCVHSSMSRLGYFIGGPETIFEALMETVGEDGCIMMPTYPTLGSVANYLETGAPFDVINTPSVVGSLTETFRKWPGVSRSLHPTNPVSVWGKGGDKLIEDHELSHTPYGDDTPFGRLSRMDNGFILMMETPLLSVLHHLQERVDFPNYLLPGIRDATVIDASGTTRVVKTKVMRPRLPYYIAIPPEIGKEPEWAILHDYSLMFPKSRVSEVHKFGYRYGGYAPIIERRAKMTAAGILKHTQIGKGEIGLVHVKRCFDILIPELTELIEEYRPYYELDRLTKTKLPQYT